MDLLTKAAEWADDEALDWENAAEEHVVRKISSSEARAREESDSKVRKCCEVARHLRLLAACARAKAAERAWGRTPNMPAKVKCDAGNKMYEAEAEVNRLLAEGGEG